MVGREGGAVLTSRWKVSLSGGDREMLASLARRGWGFSLADAARSVVARCAGWPGERLEGFLEAAGQAGGDCCRGEGRGQLCLFLGDADRRNLEAIRDRYTLDHDSQAFRLCVRAAYLSGIRPGN